MRWRIDGEDKTSGQKRTIQVTAQNQEEARLQATQKHGLRVVRIAPVVEPVKPAPPAKPAGLRNPAVQRATAAAVIAILALVTVYVATAPSRRQSAADRERQELRKRMDDIQLKADHSIPQPPVLGGGE